LTTSDFEVGIIGGGPGGSAMAGYLSKAGISCVLFEREIMPREHVGESLVPSSTRVFRDLDFLPTMEAAKFPRKYGAAWTSAAGKSFNHNFEDLKAEDYVDVRFEERAQDGVDLPYTYHVDRGKFDLLLLQHVHKMGAAVYEGIRVDRADFDADGVDVRFTMGKKEMSTRVKMLVDASGRNTLIGNQMGWKIKDPVFDQYALHTWFGGYDRAAATEQPEKDFYIFIHFLPLTNTWVWQIPISDDITSIGVVMQKKDFKVSKASREQFFWDALKTRPKIFEELQRAEQLRPFKAEGDYSYAMSKIVGDRIALVGDAARFVDPIFSTGVSIALNSSRFASKDIIAAAEAGDYSEARFKTYETTIRRGTKNWHDFITVYYRLNVLFTAFVQDPRYRLDVLKLLQGDVYDEDQPAVLAKMKSMVAAVESNPDHVLHDALGDITSHAFEPAY
jgi:1H-pyrrole-2-carbonyl-[peptidyl-carrier protein] chlorinase